MKSGIIKLYRSIVPFKIRVIPYFALENLRFRKYKRKIIAYYQNHPEEIKDAEQSEVISYLKKHPLTSIPCAHEVKEKEIMVYYDKDNGLYYVLFEDKRLYYKKGLHPIVIKKKFYAIQVEQAMNSPHRYLTDDFNIPGNSVIIDTGSAEANFGLSVVENAKKLVLIETDPGWIQALEATFKPWKDKVKIINKFVTNTNDSSSITMDSLIKQEGSVDFVKIDVDGEESKLLEGFTETLRSKVPVKIALCTYHKENDSKEFSDLLKSYGFTMSFSQGYMIFMPKNILQFPYMRKGLIRAYR